MRPQAGNHTAALLKLRDPPGSVNPPEGASCTSAPETRPEEETTTILDGRTYREGEVRGLMLPARYVRSLGLVTNADALREEWAALSVAAFLSHVTEEDEAAAVQYRNRHTGAVRRVEREEGTIHKSRQTFVEDLRRRLYKRPSAPADGDLRSDWTPDFSRDYDRIRHAIDGRLPSGLLDAEGTPTPSTGNRMIDSLDGLRWRVADTIRDCPEAPAQRDAVRSTGPAPRIDTGGQYVDVLDALERMTAWRETLHTGFTTGIRQEQTAHGPFHARGTRTCIDPEGLGSTVAEEGRDAPRYVRAGRWRPEAVEGGSVDPSAPCTVPWIVFDLDAETRAENEAHARRLMTLLQQRMSKEAFADVLAVYTGGKGYHIRVPAGAVGNGIYNSGKAAARALSRFASRLCEDDADLLAALDFRLFNPSQNLRLVGSTHTSGRRTVAMTGAEYRDHPDPFTFLRWHSEASTYAPTSLPDPTETPYCPSLAHLLHHVTRTPSTEGGDAERGSDEQTVGIQPSTGEYARALEVQTEGEKWGRDVDKPDLVGRNRACLTVSLRELTLKRTPEAAWREVYAWTQRMQDPLPESEARKTFESARRYVSRS